MHTKYWQDHKSTLLSLGKIAEGVLGIPTSLAPVEQVFNYSVSLVKYSGHKDADLLTAPLKS